MDLYKLPPPVDNIQTPLQPPPEPPSQSPLLPPDTPNKDEECLDYIKSELKKLINPKYHELEEVINKCTTAKDIFILLKKNYNNFNL